MKKPGARLAEAAAIFRVSAKSKFSYRGQILAAAFHYALFQFVFSRVWAAALPPGKEIAGYDYASCCWYFMVAEFAMFGSGSAFRDLAASVKNGEVAYRLLRPIGFLKYAWAEHLGKTLPMLPVIAVIGTAIMAAATGVPPKLTPWAILALPTSVALALTIAFFSQAAIAMTSFVFEENTAIFWIWQKLALVAGTLLPVEFLPETARQIVMATPFPWFTWAPARIAVSGNPSEIPGILAMQAVWAAAAIIVASLALSGGRRKITIQGG